MKVFLAATLLLAGCVNTTVQSVEVKGGTLCQGSRAWRENNVCGPNADSGLCIKAVDGPVVLQEIKSSDDCAHVMWVGIADTHNPWIGIDEPEQALKMNKPRWEMKSAPPLPLHIKDSSIEVRAGESLFVGTIGHNREVDSSRCYVTWTIK